MCNPRFARSVDIASIFKFGLPAAIRDEMQEVRDQVSRGSIRLFQPSNPSCDTPLHSWLEAKASPLKSSALRDDISRIVAHVGSGKLRLTTEGR